jgi:hypothetical protein
MKIDNMLKIDFLDSKTILKYIAIITILLFSGGILKDAIALLFALLIFYFSLTKNLYRAIEFFLIWLFISNFFIGQGYINSELISKYIAKPAFLLFVIFLIFINKIPRQIFHATYLKIWLVFLIMAFISAVTQGQSPFVIITISTFFMLFLILQAKGLNPEQYNKFLNLFIAVAIIQTFVSYLQVTGIISPPSKMMDDGKGGQFEWIAGLDDVASGTFGAGSSHITSWYAALISLFLFITWAVTKNKLYLLFMFVSFLQFATVDSKIIMGVTILMLVYLLLYIFKEKQTFKISIRKYTYIILILALGALGFIKAWNSYYEYYGNKTGGTRTDIKSVYQNEAKTTFDLVLSHLQDWGKIKGYQHVLEDFIQNGSMQIFWGYGIQGYEMSGKMGYIEDQDTPIMHLNNLTNSRSGLITQFAKSGLLGFILILSALYIWFKKINYKIANSHDVIKSSLLKIFLLFSLLAAFLYQIEITSIPLIVFAAIISILQKMSDFWWEIKSI